ncbi:MAG: hypothetical protein ACHBN1_06250 [Heteroscytonema crispum UTEX LB 1556]
MANWEFVGGWVLVGGCLLVVVCCLLGCDYQRDRASPVLGGKPGAQYPFTTNHQPPTTDTPNYPALKPL